MSDQHTDRSRAPIPWLRAAFGGALMGVANVIPGVSGGTMLLASGIYPDFIDGVANVSTLRLRPKPVLTLGTIAVSAIAAIVLLAGPISTLVVEQRWIMYAIFIGLTLGGVPLLWRMARPLDAPVALGAIAGIAVMAVLAFVGPAEGNGPAEGHPYFMYFLAGAAAASAMVLPGISGSYLLLVLGQYVAILSAVSALKDAARARDLAAAMEPMHLVIPVGIGVVVGVVGVSNLMKMLLARFERPTLGVLLGLLLGAVLGLWPFQQGVAPELGSAFRGDVVVQGPDGLMLERTGREIGPEEWPTRRFAPSARQVGGAVLLILAGFAGSVGIGRLGNGRSAAEEPPRTPDRGDSGA